jgi:hypothetical protein
VSSVAPTTAALAVPSAFTSILRESAYRRLWCSGLCVNGARWMDLVLLGWLAFQLTDSPFMVGLAAFARSAPLIPAAMAINGMATLLAMLPAAWPLARGSRPPNY